MAGATAPKTQDFKDNTDDVCKSGPRDMFQISNFWRNGDSRFEAHDFFSSTIDPRSYLYFEKQEEKEKREFEVIEGIIDKRTAAARAAIQQEWLAPITHRNCDHTQNVSGTGQFAPPSHASTAKPALAQHFDKSSGFSNAVEGGKHLLNEASGMVSSSAAYVSDVATSTVKAASHMAGDAVEGTLAHVVDKDTAREIRKGTGALVRGAVSLEYNSIVHPIDTTEKVASAIGGAATSAFHAAANSTPVKAVTNTVSNAVSATGSALSTAVKWAGSYSPI